MLRAIRALSLSLLLAGSVRADWAGVVQVIASPIGSGETVLGGDRGKIFAKGAKLRIEMDVAVNIIGKSYQIYDFETRKHYSVMPALRKYVESDAREASADRQHEMPGSCMRGSKDECLQAQDFRKLRDEAIGGRKCGVWERERWTHSGHTFQTIWVLDGARAVIPLKQVIKDRFTRTIVLENYSERTLPKSLFVVPSGYAKITHFELMQMFGSSPPTRVNGGPQHE